jgi:hypothetical protein
MKANSPDQIRHADFPRTCLYCTNDSEVSNAKIQNTPA